jgi:hypothetical protein
MIRLIRIWRQLWAGTGFLGYPPIQWVVWIIAIILMFFIAMDAAENRPVRY